MQRQDGTTIHFYFTGHFNIQSDLWGLIFITQTLRLDIIKIDIYSSLLACFFQYGLRLHMTRNRSSPSASVSVYIMTFYLPDCCCHGVRVSEGLLKLLERVCSSNNVPLSTTKSRRDVLVIYEMWAEQGPVGDVLMNWQSLRDHK